MTYSILYVIRCMSFITKFITFMHDYGWWVLQYSRSNYPPYIPYRCISWLSGNSRHPKYFARITDITIFIFVFALHYSEFIRSYTHIPWKFFIPGSFEVISSDIQLVTVGQCGSFTVFDINLHFSCCRKSLLFLFIEPYSGLFHKKPVMNFDSFHRTVVERFPD